MFGSLDWGSTRPFSFRLWTVSNGMLCRTAKGVSQGAMIRFDEWYGWNGKPNEGLDGGQRGCRGILKKCKRKPSYVVADPSMWKVDGGPSHAEMMNRSGLVLRKADNGRHAGYLELRGRIAGDGGGPMLYATTNCYNGFWRTMPDLVLDRNDPEDVETDNQEEHCFDETRYACMSRPWIQAAKETEVKPDRWMKFEEKTEDNWKTA